MNEVVSRTLETLCGLVSQSEVDWEALAGAAEGVTQDLSLAGRAKEDVCVAAVVRAVAALHLGRWSDAHAWGLRAVDIDPASFEANEFCAFLSAQASSLSDAAYYMKMAGTLDPSPLTWFCDFFSVHVPDAAQAFSEMGQDTLLRKGRHLMALGYGAQAEECFRGHLAFHPDSAEAYLAIAMCLMSAGQYVAAQHNLRAAMHVLPQNAAIAVALGQALYSAGDYAAGRQVYEWAMQYETDFAVQASYLLNRLTDPHENEVFLEQIYRRAIADVLHEPSSEGGALRCSAESVEPFVAGRVLTLGYIISGQRDFIENWGLANIIAAHNPVDVRVIGFGEGSLSESRNCFFQHCFSSWRDTYEMDPLTLCYLFQGEGVDVLVDTAGLLSPRCMEALVCRPVPVQISWSGLPWDPGSGVFDAVFSDAHLLEVSSSHEGAYFPLSGGATCSGLPPDDRPLSWRDGDDDEIIIGLPVRIHEMNYTAAALAAACLHRIPDSKLVLPNYDFSSDEVVSSLLMLFGTFGVAHRVDLIDVETESSFALECDLVLNPPSPWTTSRVIGALWSGVPVLAWAPCDRRQRGISSFLTEAGLGKTCVAESMEGVAALAEYWAQNFEERLSFRDKIREQLVSSAPFQYKERGQEVEAICKSLSSQKRKISHESGL